MFNREILFRVAAVMLALGPHASTLLWPEASAQAPEPAAVREIEIIVEGAYKPSRIELREGERVRLKFIRKDYAGCTREVVFPQLNVKRELPTNQIVYIALPALRAGDYEFKCGMNMIKGVLVVRAQAHRDRSAAWEG